MNILRNVIESPNLPHDFAHLSLPTASSQIDGVGVGVAVGAATPKHSKKLQTPPRCGSAVAVQLITPLVVPSGESNGIVKSNSQWKPRKLPGSQRSGSLLISYTLRPSTKEPVNGKNLVRRLQRCGILLAFSRYNTISPPVHREVGREQYQLREVLPQVRPERTTSSGSFGVTPASPRSIPREVLA